MTSHGCYRPHAAVALHTDAVLLDGGVAHVDPPRQDRPDVPEAAEVYLRASGPHRGQLVAPVPDRLQRLFLIASSVSVLSLIGGAGAACKQV